jgi:predicted DNA-binding protein
MKKLQLFLAEELHARFKSVCALEGKDMTTVIREFIERFVEKAEARQKK